MTRNPVESLADDLEFALYAAAEQVIPTVLFEGPSGDESAHCQACLENVVEMREDFTLHTRPLFR